MLVNWTRTGVKVIPIGSSKEMVVLAPGYNQVDDEKWKACRDLVLCQIADGRIVEEWLDVEKNGAKHKEAVLSIRHEDAKLEATTVHVPATFRDITRKRIKDVVKETFNPKTLQAWYDDETRDDVRVMVFQQMEAVKKGTIQG